jgi:DNA-binding NarL/FixJ family response regulator
VIRVLIVDDSALIRERLKTMLSEIAGVEIVGESEDKMEAIASNERLHPDVVILDIRLPTGDGIEVLQHIKRDTPSVIVIMLTNYPYPQYRQKCLKAGADFFFDKSTEFEKVPEVLMKLTA